MAEPDDPVREGVGEGEDLYDVATWDDRTVLDQLSVLVYGALRTALPAVPIGGNADGSGASPSRDSTRSRVLVGLAVLLFVGIVGFALFLVLEDPMLGVVALLSLLPALCLVGYFWLDSPTRREPLAGLATTFLLSFLLATVVYPIHTVATPRFTAVVSGLVASVSGGRPVVSVLVATGLYFFLVTGPLEETVKWLAVRVHAFRTPSFDTVVDGVVYGAVAGLGFVTIENIPHLLEVYDIAQRTPTQLDLSQAVQAAVQRAVVGPVHVLWTAIAGYYLGLAKFNPDRSGPIVVKGLLVAAGLHAVYNTTAAVWTRTGIFGPLGFATFVLAYYGLLFGFLHRKLSRYGSYYRRVESGIGDGSAETTPRPADPED